jgi:hypothetical protein
MRNDDRDSRVLREVEALAGTVDAPRMVAHTPAPPPAPTPTPDLVPVPAPTVRALLRRVALCWALWSKEA